MTLHATTRRSFLQRAAAGVAAVWGVAWLGPGCRDAAGVHSPRVEQALEAYFGASGVEVAARTGRVGLRLHADPAALRAEALALGESAAGRTGVEDTVAAWRRQVGSEFSGLETVSLANWQVAPTELRLYALAALAEGE